MGRETDARGAMNVFWTVVARAGGLGQVTWAPGTAASLATVVVWAALPLSSSQQWAVGGVLALIGWVAAEREARRQGAADPSDIVIDEVAGMWFSLCGLSRNWISVLVALALFRFLDICKPLFINNLQRIKGGAGIMADDLAAGLLARGMTAILVGMIGA